LQGMCVWTIFNLFFFNEMIFKKKKIRWVWIAKKIGTHEDCNLGAHGILLLFKFYYFMF